MDNPLVTSTEDAALYHTFQFLNYFTQPPLSCDFLLICI